MKTGHTISAAVRYEDRVNRNNLNGGTYLVLPAPVKDVVSFSGSFLNIPTFGSSRELVRDLVVSMLDKGTQSRTKTELASELESLGALVRFSTDGIRVRVSGQSLSEHLPRVLALVAEQLAFPSFPESEFQLTKARFEAALQHSLTETGTLATGALSRTIYNPGHPFYTSDPQEDLEQLSRLSLDEIVDFYQSSFSFTEWTLAVVGDTEWKNIRGVFETEYAGLESRQSELSVPDWLPADNDPGIERFFVPDRSNIDVRMGHAVQVSPTDDEYIPLYLGNYILGGNFSARLMNVIRDEMGLTYGINSSLTDLDPLHFGTWKISVTLSVSDVDRGIDETIKLVRVFAEKGVTSEETEEKKETVSGSYKVGLSSTRSLAGTLLRNQEKGRDPSYLDRFPALVLGVTTEEINRGIRKHIHPDRLHIVMAGSVEKKGKE